MRRWKPVALHAVLMTGVVVSTIPFYWTFVMATNTTADIRRYPPKLTPGGELWNNLRRLFDTIDVFSSLLNTVIVACSITVLVLFFDSLAAFTFAKYDFPGKRVLFTALIGTYLLPVQLAIVPQFVTMVHLHWVGSLKALIVPSAANAFGIFWMRQYVERAVPNDLLAAARIDGCGFFRQYWHVAVPLLRPGLAFLGIFTFVGAWNDYIWPLIVFSNADHTTLQVALSQLNTVHTFDYSLVMTGALVAVVPLLIVFTLFARNFVRDLAKGALQG